MKLIQASKVNEEKLEQFIGNNHQIDLQSLLKSGYVVEFNEKIIGCFELELMENDAYWLKQLYIIQNEAIKLPILLEFILVFAKQREAKVIYAHSERPVTDLLLESLSFSLQQEKTFNHVRKQKGHWWSYEVC